jgi:hypothetical protein
MYIIAKFIYLCQNNEAWLLTRKEKKEKKDKKKEEAWLLALL